MHDRELLFSVRKARLASLLAAFRSRFPHRQAEPHVERTTYLDTFDRRILADGGSLDARTREDGCKLFWRRDGKRRTARAGERPTFAADLPARLREVGELIEPRRLLPLGVVEHEVQELEIVDGEGRTIARLFAFERRAAAEEPEGPWKRLPTLLQAHGVRGHPAALAELESWLGEHADAAPRELELREVLAVLGREQTPGESDPVVLDPDRPALDAIRAALAPELASWLAQQEGLRADLDTEFLHEARVALRRTRSVLRQMRSVLPRSASKELAGELRWMGLASGTQRDMDVFLAELAELTVELPRGSREACDELEAFARAERERERAELLAALESQRCAGLVEAWRAFVEPLEGRRDDPGIDGTEADRTPILAAVARRIEKLHGRVVTLGKHLDPGSPSAALHELRIECKKLRYLIDVFRSLFPREDAKLVDRAIKRFQNALGQANDARVQGRLMEELADRMQEAGQGRPAGWIAIGRLLETLEARERRARRDFFRRFRSYARSEERWLLARWAASAQENVGRRADDGVSRPRRPATRAAALGQEGREMRRADL